MSQRGMRIVVAPDSFKGCLMAWDVAQAIRAGALAALPDAQVRVLPLGDGGEGTARALALAVPGSAIVPVTVQDPLGRQITAEFALLPGRRAVVEMAAASGLGLISTAERDPMTTDSRGTGQLVAAALDALHSPPASAEEERSEDGPELILGVGGSATVDGGLGLLDALGARFFDREGRELTAFGGASLARVARCDLGGLDPRIGRTRITLASDVDNPLLGPDGAAAVFGPQKGASPADVVVLDRGLASLRDVILADAGRDIAGFPGAGAAGGVGGIAVGVLGARFRPGIEIALELMDFCGHLSWADLVVTGEGRFDRQTLHGKAAWGVAKAAAAHGVPVCVLAGEVVPEAEWQLPGEVVVMTIANGPLTFDESQAHASRLLSQAARRMVRLFWLGGQGRHRSRPSRS